MNKYTLVVISAFSLLAGQVFAQEAGKIATTSDLYRDRLQNIRSGIKDVRRESAEEVKQLRQDTRREVEIIRAVATTTREEIKGAVRRLREDAQQEFEKRREAAKQQVEKQREMFKQTMEQRREMARRTIEQNREKLKEQLQKVRDERKRTTVERVDLRFEEINKNRTDHFLNVINRLEEILQNVASRADKAELNGKNITTIKSDIAAAQAIIASARAKIMAQSAKTYAITVTGEANLQKDVRTTRDSLYNDLRVAQNAVSAVREVIQKAAVDLAKIPGVNTLEVGSSTTTPATTTSATTTNQ